MQKKLGYSLNNKCSGFSTMSLARQKSGGLIDVELQNLLIVAVKKKKKSKANFDEHTGINCSPSQINCGHFQIQVAFFSNIKVMSLLSLQSRQLHNLTHRFLPALNYPASFSIFNHSFRDFYRECRTKC